MIYWAVRIEQLIGKKLKSLEKANQMAIKAASGNQFNQLCSDEKWCSINLIFMSLFCPLYCDISF